MRLKLIIPFMLCAASAAHATDHSSRPTFYGRVAKLEKEMHAVQRKVFPGGSPHFFKPEITPAKPAGPPAGFPATSPVVDLGARADSLERALARITGKLEQNSFKIRQIQEAFDRFQEETNARLIAIESAASLTGRTLQTPPQEAIPHARIAAAATPVPRSTTGDPAEDAYLVGYRLWHAQKYREAEKALKAVVSKYPKHNRASYAQNLLGRAYLDEGRPAMAAKAFYDNYKKMPHGERAPDSLYFLGQALLRLKRPAKACKAYAEMQDVFGATLSDSLRNDVARARAEAKCRT